jgi:diguanylate cyclase (GGDEF)-like protein
MELDAIVRSEVLDAIANGIVVLDSDSRVVMWNKWMVRHSGIPSDIALGHGLSNIFPDIVGTRLSQAVQTALTHRLAAMLSPSIHRPVLPLYRRPNDRARDERMRQLINITPIRLGHVGGCTVQVQDMTPTVLREQHFREQAQQLESANTALQSKLDEIELLHQQLEHASLLDPLTGIFNRRHLNKLLEREVTGAVSTGHPLSVVMFDVDSLKKINDTYGQQAGDEVLKGVGKVLADEMPAEFYAGRVGDEEFLVILPNVEVTAAAVHAEAWRQRFADADHQFGRLVIKATMSGGVAGYPQHGLRPTDLTQCASLAVYLAKHDGRNRVTVFDAESAGGQ